MTLIPTRNSVWCVLKNEENKYLLLKRSKYSNNAGQWNFPGGGVEPGEDAVVAGSREFHEECGANIPVSNWVAVTTIHSKDRSMNFIRPKQVLEPKIFINSESSKYGWFDIKELRDKNLHFPTQQFFKYLNNKEHLKYRQRLVKGQLFLDITAAMGEEIVACAKICLPSRKLHNVEVAPFYRGLGFGHALMSHVMSLPNHPIQLTANAESHSGMNIQALVNWYRTFGFIETAALASTQKSGPVTMKLGLK